MSYTPPPRRPAGVGEHRPGAPVAGASARFPSDGGAGRPFGEPIPREEVRQRGARVSERRRRDSGPQPGLDPVAQPLRYPDERDQKTMGRRAWWLIALNILIPGSVQALAGNRALGKAGLTVTLLGWALVVVALIVFLTGRASAVTFVTNPWVLTLVQILCVVYLAFWIVLTLDTLRLTRLVRVSSAAKLGVPAAALAVLVVLVGVGGYGVGAAAAARGVIGSVFGGTVTEPPVDGRYNILLLGGDDGADRDGLRPDSITVASIDATTGQTVLIGLPREMQDVPFPDDSPMHALFPNGFTGCQSSVCYLNSIYTEVSVFHPDLYPDAAANGSKPGWEATRDAVEAITGLHIQYLVTVDMAGFAQLIDALGGVTINVEERLPIGGQAEDLSDVKAWIEPGVQHMDGNTALWYARSRHGAGNSDYVRMDRQKVVEEAVLRQFDPTTVVEKFQQIAAAGSQVLSTTVPQSMVGTFIDLAVKAKDTQIQKLELDPDSQVDPAKPDWAYVQQLVDKAVGKASPAP